MLACERHGSGEPLVLVHGVTHRRQAWYPVLDQLAEHREVILVDLPGHGQSDPFDTDGLPVAEALRRDFRQFLTEQELDRPHVAGNSLGGRVALEAGASGDARSVTALSPAGFWRTEASFAYTRKLFLSAANMSERLGPRVELLSRTSAGRRVMYSVLMAHPARVSRDHAMGDIRAFNYARPALHRLLAAATPFTDPIPADVPVTIAWGARDMVLPPWQAQVARELLPNAAHIMMRGVGHVPMHDAPDFVARVLLRGSESVAEVAPIASAASARPRARRKAAAVTA
ncbi:MAG TPA: alpha/beta fold hydrolase [Jatrophihabitantaceae bacterium]|jgi:pimeloyl-ACP methyl ester carboxylesterase|nr:alpha/beta fold hydrolase [Jatrophihabitantaceae bacterium]